MKTEKKLGIWMDHSSAYLMEFTMDNAEEQIKSLEFVHEDIKHDLSKGESLMHNKQQHQLKEFYNKLGDSIKNYHDVILFGPTDAKVELLNILKADHQFENIKIETQSADKMTENQQHAFVKEYFSKN
jgi:hypothetical protein